MGCINLFNSKKTLNNAAKGFNGLVEITDDDRIHIQSALLGIFDDIRELCETLDITLYLCGGTALGAIRHKGFIPWDDDFDIALSRKDFNKLKESFSKSKLNQEYILNAPNYSAYPKDRFAQLIKKGTIFEEIGDFTDDIQLKGLKIDIFVIDNTPDFCIKRFVKGFICDLMEFVAPKVRGVENKSDSYKEFMLRGGKVSYYISCFIGRIFSFADSSTWLNRIDKFIQEDNSNSKYCTIATGRGHYFGEMLPRKDFYPSKDAEFCHRKVNVFQAPDHYLENLYGDYMQVPPEEERERHFVKTINLN